MRRFPQIAWMLLVLALGGCESADEKAERLRLENLYALDDLKVAQAYKKADFAGAAYAKEYLEIKRECAKEEMKTKGKWCEKYSKLEKLYNQLQSESLRSMPQAPKF